MWYKECSACEYSCSSKDVAASAELWSACDCSEAIGITHSASLLPAQAPSLNL
jgi:hypothetical protein